MASGIADNFAHNLVGIYIMKHRILLGNGGGEGNLKEGTGMGDDVGELREEEIVWGETEVTHLHKETIDVIGSSAEKPMIKIIGGRSHRAMGRQRSMLSRQLEASTWTAGDRMSMAAAAKIVSSKRPEMEEMGGGGKEEEGGLQQLQMDKLIPPHELLARQYATSASFSVLHGAGRTLKGKDLLGLRNEVWRQTGFVD